MLSVLPKAVGNPLCKFRIRGTAIIAFCANCGIAHADERRAAESKALDKAKKLARNSWSLWQGSASSMISLNRRFRYVPSFLLGALNHRSCTSARRSCLWRDLSRRDSRGCANGHSSRRARNNLRQKKAPALSAEYNYHNRKIFPAQSFNWNVDVLAIW